MILFVVLDGKVRASSVRTGWSLAVVSLFELFLIVFRLCWFKDFSRGCWQKTWGIGGSFAVLMVSGLLLLTPE